MIECYWNKKIIMKNRKRIEKVNIFDEIDENLFRPLTGTNKRKYIDILTLIWDKCKRMPMYAIENGAAENVE